MGFNIAKLPNVDEQQHIKHTNPWKKKKKSGKKNNSVLNRSSERQAQHQGVDSLTCNPFIPEGLVQFEFCISQEYCLIITADFRGSDF